MTTEEEFLGVLNMDPQELDVALRQQTKFTKNSKDNLGKILKSKTGQPKSIIDKIKELRGITTQVSGSLTDAPTEHSEEKRPKEQKQATVKPTPSPRKSSRLAERARKGVN